jgi:hypothetical protein
MTLYVFASPPTSRIPSTMEHGVDENLGPSNLEKYGVREPTEKRHILTRAEFLHRARLEPHHRQPARARRIVRSTNW